MDTKVALKRLIREKGAARSSGFFVKRCLRFDQCVGIDPAQFYSTLYKGYYTTVSTVFMVLVVQSIFNISDYQTNYSAVSSSIPR